MKYTAFLQTNCCKFAVYFIFIVYDRTQRKHVATRKVERQEDYKGCYRSKTLRQIITVANVSQQDNRKRR